MMNSFYFLISLLTSVNAARFYARLGEQEGNSQFVIDNGYYGELWADVTVGQSIEIELSHNVKHTEECGNTTAPTHCIYIEDTSSGDVWYPGDSNGNITNLIQFFSTGLLFPNNSIQHTPDNVTDLFMTGKVTINVVYNFQQQLKISGAIYSIDDTPVTYSLEQKNITSSSNQLDLEANWDATFQVISAKRLGGGYPVRFSCAVFLSSNSSLVISNIEFRTSSRIALLQNVTMTGYRAEGLFYSGSSILSSPSLTLLINGIEMATSPMVPFADGNMSFIAVLQGGQVIGGTPSPTDFSQEIMFSCEYDALSKANFTEIKIIGSHQLAVPVVYDLFLGAIGVEAVTEPVATIFTNGSIVLNFTGTPDYTSQVQYLSPAQISSLRNGGYYISSRAEQAVGKYYTRGQILPLKNPKTMVSHVYPETPSFEEPVVGVVRYRKFGPIPVAVVDGFGSSTWTESSTQIWRNNDYPGPTNILPSKTLFFSTSSVICGIVPLGPSLTEGSTVQDTPFMIRLSNNTNSINNDIDHIGAGTLDDYTATDEQFQSSLRSESDASQYGFFSINAEKVTDNITMVSSVEFTWKFSHNIIDLDKKDVSCDRTFGCLNLVKKNINTNQYDVVVNLVRNRFAGPSPVSSISPITDSDIDPSQVGMVTLLDIHSMIINKELYVQLMVNGDDNKLLGLVLPTDMSLFFETTSPAVDFRLSLQLSTLNYHLDCTSGDNMNSQVQFPSTSKNKIISSNEYAMSDELLTMSEVRDLFQSKVMLSHLGITSVVEGTSLRVFSFYTLPGSFLNSSLYFSLSPTVMMPEDPLSFDAMYNLNKNPILLPIFDNTRSKENSDYENYINRTTVAFTELKKAVTGKFKQQLALGTLQLNNSVLVVGDDFGVDQFNSVIPDNIEVIMIVHPSSGGVELVASAVDSSEFIIEISGLGISVSSHSFCKHRFGTSYQFLNTPGIGLPTAIISSIRKQQTPFSATVTGVGTSSGFFSEMTLPNSLTYQCVDDYLQPADGINTKSRVSITVDKSAGTITPTVEINQPQVEGLYLGIGRLDGFRLPTKIPLNGSTPITGISPYLMRSIMSGFGYAVLVPIHVDLSRSMSCQLIQKSDNYVSQISSPGYEDAEYMLSGLIHSNGGLTEFQISAFMQEDKAAKVVPALSLIFLGGLDDWAPDYGWYMIQQNKTEEFLKSSSELSDKSTGKFKSDSLSFSVSRQLLPWEVFALRFSSFFLNITTGIDDQDPTVLEVRSVSEITKFSAVWESTSPSIDFLNNNFILDSKTSQSIVGGGPSGGNQKTITEMGTSMGVVFVLSCGNEQFAVNLINETQNMFCLRSGLAKIDAKNLTTGMIEFSGMIVPSVSDANSAFTTFESDIHRGYVFPSLGPNYVPGRGFTRGTVYWGAPGRMVISLQLMMDSDFINLSSDLKGCPCNTTCVNIFEGIASYPTKDNNVTVRCDQNTNFVSNYLPVMKSIPSTGYASVVLQGKSLQRIALAVASTRAFLGVHLNTSIPYDSYRGLLHRPILIKEAMPVVGPIKFDERMVDIIQPQVSELFLSKCTNSFYTFLSVFIYQPSSQTLSFNVSSSEVMKCVGQCYYLSKKGGVGIYYLMKDTPSSSTEFSGKFQISLLEYLSFVKSEITLTVGGCTADISPQSSWQTRMGVDIERGVSMAKAGLEQRQLKIKPTGQPVNNGKLEIAEHIQGKTIFRIYHNVDHNIKCTQWHTEGCLQLRYGTYDSFQGQFAFPITQTPQAISSPSEYLRSRLPMPVLRAAENGYLFSTYLTNLDLEVARGQFASYPGIAPLFTGFGQLIQSVEGNMILLQSHVRIVLSSGAFFIRIETVATRDAGYDLSVHELELTNDVGDVVKTVVLSTTGLSFVKISLLDLHKIISSSLKILISVELSNTNTRLTTTIKSVACSSPTCRYRADLLTYNTEGKLAVRDSCVIYRSIAECSNRETCIWNTVNSTCTPLTGTASVTLVQNTEIQYQINSSLGDKNTVVEGATCVNTGSPGCAYFTQASPVILVPNTFFKNDVSYSGSKVPVSNSLEITPRSGKGAERYPRGVINATEIGSFSFTQHWALMSGRLAVNVLGTYKSVTTSVMRGVLLPEPQPGVFILDFSSTEITNPNAAEIFSFTAKFYPGTGDLYGSGILRYQLTSNQLPESCIITNTKLLQPGCVFIKRADKIEAVLDYGRVDQELRVVRGEVLITADLVHVMSRQQEWGITGVQADVVMMSPEGDTIQKRSIKLNNPLTFETPPLETPLPIVPEDNTTPIATETSSDSIDTWVIIVIVVGILACLMLGLFFLYKRHKQQEATFSSKGARSGSIPMYDGFSLGDQIALQAYPSEPADVTATPYEQLQSGEESGQNKMLNTEQLPEVETLRRTNEGTLLEQKASSATNQGMANSSALTLIPSSQYVPVAPQTVSAASYAGLPSVPTASNAINELFYPPENELALLRDELQKRENRLAAARGEHQDLDSQLGYLRSDLQQRESSLAARRAENQQLTYMLSAAKQGYDVSSLL